jgi:hypothetical protein
MNKERLLQIIKQKFFVFVYNYYLLYLLLEKSKSSGETKVANGPKLLKVKQMSKESEQDVL